MPAQRLKTTLALLFGPLLAGLALPAHANWLLNMPVGVTSISREIHDLHMLVFWVCVAIAVVVFGAMIFAIVRFRKSAGAVADRNLTHSTQAEILWTAIPTLILIFLAYQAAPALVNIEDTRNAEMTIKITGYQWKWRYEYLGKDVAFFSNLAEASNQARQLRSGIDVRTVDHYLLDVDQPLVVPTDTKIRYLLTASDVLHAWWVPAFGVKRDAIPGYINEGWFQVDEPGIYRGQCAELCGKDHGFMPIVVRAVPKAEFESWLAERRDGTPAAALAAN